MPKDQIKNNSGRISGRSAAENNQGTGISLPAVHPFGAQQMPAQLMKIKSKTLNKTIDTKRETDVKLLKKFRSLYKNSPGRVAAIDKRIAQLENVNPFTGFEQAIPGQVPSSSTDKDITRLSSGGKRSKKQGQDFKLKSLPKKYTPLTNPDGKESHVPRLKVEKLENWDGKDLQLKWIPDMRGDQQVLVPFIQCTYTLDWIRAEEADLDHVVPTQALKKHLHSIAKKMNEEPGYSDSVEKWLSDEGLNVNDWFMQTEKRKKWVPTQWAMYELHNDRGNIVFSSKYFNQQSKNNKSTIALITENPWFGEQFFKQHQFLPVNEHIGSVDGEGIGSLLETHLTTHHLRTSEALYIEKWGERKMSVGIKQRGLGLLDDEKKKSLSRKIVIRDDFAELSDDASSGPEDEKEHKDVSRVKIIRKLISKKRLESSFPKVEDVENMKDTMELMRKKIEELEAQKKLLEEQIKPTKSKKKKSLKKKEKAKDMDSGSESDRDDEKDRGGQQNRKRPRSTELLPSTKKRSIEKERLESYYKSVDGLLKEDEGSNKARIEAMHGIYHNPGMFIGHYTARIKMDYGNDSWQNWVAANQKNWIDVKNYLAKIYKLLFT